MSLRVWRDHVVPRLTDIALDNDEVAQLRAEVCRGLAGRVLEVGFGSGLNVAHYPTAVASVTAVEPADTGWALSASRRHRSLVPIQRSGLDGQHLDEPEGSFDAVLSTFTLCTIPDAALALREVHRVLRPGGRVHFLEHGLAPDPRVRRWQHRLEPLQRRVAGGCHLTRDVPALLHETRFEADWLEARHLMDGPAISRPFTWGWLGVATPAQ